MKECKKLHIEDLESRSFTPSGLNRLLISLTIDMSTSFFETSVATGEELFTAQEEEEFMPVVSFWQHTNEDFQFEDQEQENDESDDEPAAVVEKGKRRKKKPSVELPAPPEFQPLSRQEHKAFIRLPTPFDLGDPAPISLFRLFFTDTILNTIVMNTNLYALSKDAGSVGRVWTPIDSDELVVWIALTVYQGLHRMSACELCWNLDEREPHRISQYMKLICYQQIKRYLHVSSLEATISNYFNKLELLLSHIHDASKKYYTPGTNVSVDEMMVRFSGRSMHTVHMKNKLIPEGFKILSLCDSGYTYTFIPTSRVAPTQVTRVEGLTQTGNTVNHLVQRLPYSWLSFNVYMDNYFSSVKLFQHLRNIGIGACGTARRQAGIPKELQVDKAIKLDWDTWSGIVQDGVTCSVLARQWSCYHADHHPWYYWRAVGGYKG